MRKQLFELKSLRSDASFPCSLVMVVVRAQLRDSILFEEKNQMSKFDDIFEDPFEELGGIGIFGGAIIGGVVGLILGYMNAGVGGAIAYCIGGVIIGAIGGFVIIFLIGVLISVLPWVMLIAFIGFIVWLCEILWNVGKP